MASLAMYAPLEVDFLEAELADPLLPLPISYRAPLLEEWQKLLDTGNLSEPARSHSHTPKSDQE
jgi:hypothetical protein